MCFEINDNKQPGLAYLSPSYYFPLFCPFPHFCSLLICLIKTGSRRQSPWRTGRCGWHRLPGSDPEDTRPPCVLQATALNLQQLRVPITEHQPGSSRDLDVRVFGRPLLCLPQAMWLTGSWCSSRCQA